MIRGAPFGKAFGTATLDNFEVVPQYNGKAHEACLNLVRGEIRGLVLQGPVGVGKTHLLAGLARAFVHARNPEEQNEDYEPLVALPKLRELVENIENFESELSKQSTLDPAESQREIVVEYWPMLDLASELRSEVTRGDLYLSQRCRLCDLLILDDLGREKMSEFILQELQRIIDWRYREMLPIAIATNKKHTELRDRYEEHTFSHLIESCVFVHVAGSDYRRTKAEAR